MDLRKCEILGEQSGDYSVDKVGDDGPWNTAVAEELKRSEQCHEILRRSYRWALVIRGRRCVLDYSQLLASFIDMKNPKEHPICKVRSQRARVNFLG